MDIKKLIEGLQSRARLKKPFIAPGEIWTGGMIRDELCADAADALSTLHAENEKLRTEKVKVIGNDELMDELQAVQDENEKLRAELEQVKRERDVAINEVECTVERYIPLGPLDRLRELAQADRDGRCVVLPCKIGDTVYSIRHERVPNDEYRMSFHTEMRIISQKFGLIHADCIGKSVFLTREDAEAALRREQE